MAEEKTIITLIVGAGDAGRLVAEDFIGRNNTAVRIIGFVDDDPQKQRTTISRVPVLGTTAQLAEVIENYNVDQLLIALPSQRGKIVRDIINATTGMDLTYKILPRAAEVLSQDFGDDYVRYVRKVRPEDLLGGEIEKTDQENIEEYAKGKVVLITGAAGSIGSELSRQLASYGSAKIVFYDWWENGIYELKNQILEIHPGGDYEFIIGDIKDRERLDAILATYKPNTIFHAAAYKHVPLMELNASEAIKNNILGTKNVAELAVKNGVEKFVLVSTDKAVNPTNVMGATKRAAEQIINSLSQSQNTTSFCAVRFGNVINSNGSAIPFFLNQIAKGGPVTVTHPDITRFFMTIPEAVHLILRAWTIGENNDLFVLDMGESVKIYELAETLIALEGYVPNEDIAINIIGLRPGEKLYEELLMDHEGLNATTIEKVFRTKNDADFHKDIFMTELNDLASIVIGQNTEPKDVKQLLQHLVSTYHPVDN